MAKDKGPTNAQLVEKTGSIDDLISICDKIYGSGSLILGRDRIKNVDVFRTGIASFDILFGGFPVGRTVEIFGPESSGKTTFCLELMAACQKHYFKDKERYGRVAFIDAEHALDPDWATALGVDLDKILFSQPNSGEEALDLLNLVVKSGQADLVIIDSVAALTPMEELNGDIGDQQIGALARMIGKSLRQTVAASSRTKTSVIFINQVRQKIGVMFGSPDTTPGGNALKFFSTCRFQLTRGSQIKDGEAVIGYGPKVKIIKSKIGRAYEDFTFNIYVGNEAYPYKGIDKEESLIKVMADAKKIITRGSWYSHGDVKLGAGIKNASQFLRDSAETKEKIFDELYQIVEDRKDKDKGEDCSIDCEILDDDSNASV